MAPKIGIYAKPQINESPIGNRERHRQPICHIAYPLQPTTLPQYRRSLRRRQVLDVPGQSA